MAEDKVFSSLFDGIDYVLLGHRDDSPLVGNMKTVISDRFIYIEDNELDNLFQYDHAGSLHTVFKSTGSGPGEFVQIQDYQIKNDTVIIFDYVSAKLIYLDTDGKFLREPPLKVEASNFHVGNNYKLLFYSGFPNSEDMVFTRMGDNGEKSPYLHLSTNSSGGGVRLLHGMVPDVSTGMLSVTLPYSYDVAFIDSSGYLAKVRKFEFDHIPTENNLPLDHFSPAKINVFFPFPKFYFLSQFFGRTPYYLLFDRNFKLTYLAKNLRNDLDGMNLHIYPVAFHEDQLFLYFHSSSIYDTYKKSEATIKETYPDAAIHRFIDQNGAALQDDRHVLVKLRFRDDPGE